MTTNTANSKAPWHLWVVGVFGLLWNAFGCYDYIMSMTKGVEHLRDFGMTEDQIAHFQAMPVWMTVAWTVGVWGAILGSVLLLLRSKWAFEVFCASLVAFVASLVYTYLLVPMPGNSVDMMLIQGFILAGCLFFVWYSHWMRKAGYLR